MRIIENFDADSESWREGTVVLDSPEAEQMRQDCPLTPQEQEAYDKYTVIRMCFGVATLVLTIDHQSFDLQHYGVEAGAEEPHLEWRRRMLAKALSRLIHSGGVE